MNLQRFAMTAPVATDRIRTALPAIPYASGAAGQTNITKTNYLCELECELTGTMTCIGTSTNTLGSKGPLALVQAIALVVNSKKYPLSADAFMFSVRRMIDRPGSKNAAVAPVVSSASPGTANAWQAFFRLPVAVAFDRNDLRGAIWAQNGETVMTLDVQFATEAQAITLGAANTAEFVGNLQVYAWCIAAPNPVAPDAKNNKPSQGLWNSITWLHQFNKIKQAITVTGDNIIDLQKGLEIMRIFIAIFNGGTYTTDILTSAYVELQSIVSPASLDRLWLRNALVDDYHFPYDAAGLPYVPGAAGQPEFNGLYVLDYFKTFTDRDLLQTAGLTDVKLHLEISAGASLSGAYAEVYQAQLLQLSSPITKV